ncbi:olfactomedin-4-like [Mixophyes fleayi]|uniref:olfactomedin-4-like n=1 Tax=Mixophyes fleayi TaxID=3061075 RepID=UPI003F4E01EF
MDTMLAFFILILGVCQNQANSLYQNSTGLLDENGVCLCAVILPDSTFPAGRLEILEVTNRNLSITVEKEITKIHNYQSILIVYIEKLKNLTIRVEEMEKSGITYTELEFELVKLEIKEMETIILQLKTSLNGSNVLVETLYLEIRNISIMVNQLEVYDKNNVLAIRREILALQKRLEACEKNNTKPNSPPVDYGTCDHGGIVNISKPFVVHLNWLGFSYKYGGWGRDSFLGSDQSVQWVAPLNTDERIMNTLRFYPSYNDLLIYANNIEKTLAVRVGNGYDYNNCGQGGGMIMFNNTMYYNCYNSRNLCKFNRQTNVVQRLTLTEATYTNRFSYSSSSWQDIDLAGDENGLWVIYSSEAKSGHIIISKLDAISLVVIETWYTSQYKRGVTNAFMSCGVLYATRSLNTRQEEIFYMYDTKTSEEGYLSIRFDKMMENVQSLSYNPNNHKLYMYNDGYLVNYDLTFMPLKGKKS